MKKLLFSGAATALVTPMKSDGSLNLEKYKELIDFQIDNGIDAIVAVGTTGENATLSADEHRALMDAAAQAVNKRVPLICSVGSNDTAYGCETAKSAYKAGADGILLVTPYYNKCTQAGLISHYEQLLEAAGLPAVIYNVPSRTGFCISLETYVKLSTHPLIVGVKEASSDVSLAGRIISECGNELPVYSGCDDLTVPIMSLGGKGVISVMSNIIPAETARICRLCLDNDFEAARILALKYSELAASLFSEVNPIPIKAAMKLTGLCDDNVRLPLTKMSEQKLEALKIVLEKQGLIMSERTIA